MTQIYIDGHEKVKLVRVAAGLNISAVDLLNIDWETGISPKMRTLIDGDESET